VASDLAVASLLAQSAARGAAESVNVNLPLVRDPAWEAATAKRAAVLQARIDLLAESTRHVVLSGVSRRPEESIGAVPVVIDPREVTA
jgi:formiminotetrahydrofolate cyclodeaminase